jgi:hypothetical protein
MRILELTAVMVAHSRRLAHLLNLAFDHFKHPSLYFTDCEINGFDLVVISHRSNCLVLSHVKGPHCHLMGIGGTTSVEAALSITIPDESFSVLSAVVSEEEEEEEEEQLQGTEYISCGEWVHQSRAVSASAVINQQGFVLPNPVGHQPSSLLRCYPQTDTLHFFSESDLSLPWREGALTTMQIHNSLCGEGE